MTLTVILLLIIAALMGSLYMGYVYHRLRQPVLFGAVAGGAAGIVGALFFMLPLNFCTFEPERAIVDIIMGVLLMGIGMALTLFVTQWLSRYFLAKGKDKPLLTGDRVQGGFNTTVLVPIFLLIPTLIILALFLYYPALDLFRLSTLLARLNTPRTVFRCTDNFSQILDPQFSIITLGAILLSIFFLVGIAYIQRIGETRNNPLYNTMRSLITPTLLAVLLSVTVDLFARDYRTVVYNTFFIAGWTVILGILLGLAVAYLVFQPVKGAAIYRTLLIWPYAISPAVAGIIFFLMFDPLNGIINHLLSLIGIQGPNWIKDAWLAKWTIIIASVWKTLGYNILFCLAGLQNISKELQEAAAIDGANAWQRFWNVVFPGMTPILFFLLITNITFAFFEMFGTIDFLTKGGPAGATTTIIYEVYTLGIIEGDLGKAAAQSLVMFVMVIGITIFQFRTSGEQVSYGA
jgi:sn-glycerol 3-phosphate transport system permease protein